MVKRRGRAISENLTAMRPGEEFEIVRAPPESCGIRNPHLAAGARWCCQYRGTAIMLLISESGQAISVRRDVARHVRVQRTNAHAQKPLDLERLLLERRRKPGP